MADLPNKTRVTGWKWPLIAVAFVAWMTWHSLFIWPDVAERSGYDAPFTAPWQAISLTTVMGVSALGSLAVALMFSIRDDFSIAPDLRMKVTYGVAVTPAVYGLVTAMFTAHTAIYVPFGGGSLAAIATVYLLGRSSRA